MFEELRRRNVHRVAIAYVAGAWLLVQVVETLRPAFDWPGQFLRVVIILLTIGFIPALILAWVFEWTPEGIRRESETPARSPVRDSKFFDRVITVLLVLAVAYFAIDKFVFDPARDEAEIASATEEATKRALSGAFLDEFRDRSILVLPFLNLSSDPEQEFFADGISEELLNVLARIEDLRVISRSTAWAFKGKDVDIAELRRRLDVSHILEGSVRKAGNDVRITAQLIDARTDTHLWSETYDRTFDDIFAIQDEISVEVADRLHLELFGSDSPHEGIDPRAYELLLRSRIVPEQAGSTSSRRIEAAKDMLEQALEIEPDYLPALYDLAVVHEQLGKRGSADDQAEARTTVSDLVNRMSHLAPDSVYVSNWRAYIAMEWHNDLIVAARHLEQGMRHANRTDVHIWFNGAIGLLSELGRYDEAIVVGQYMVNRNPGCTGCLSILARAMRWAGRHREAALIFESLLEWREPDSTGYWNIGVAFLVAGEPEKALHYFEKIPVVAESIDREYAQAFALYSLGHIDDFESILADRLSNYPRDSAESIARLYAWSNQPDEAFEWLEKMVADQGPASVRHVKTDLYEPIKSDTRWQQLLERYGVADDEALDIDYSPQYPPALQRAVDALSR